MRLPRRGYTLVLAPAGGARVECLHARDQDVALSYGETVEVVVRRPGLVLDGEDVDVEEERATIRHILRLLERDGHQFGVQVRYQHLTELEAAA